MLGKQDVATDALNIDQQGDNNYLTPDTERKQKHLSRKMNQKGYQDLQLSTSSCLSNFFLLQRHRSLQMDL